MSRLLALARRGRDYVRYDLREIIFPSSLPDPPGYVQLPRPKLGRVVQRIVSVLREYKDTWDPAKVRAELRRNNPEEAERRDAADEKWEQQQQQQAQGPTVAEDFAAAARGGRQALKPFLVGLYQTRTASYRAALQQFVEGYREGFETANSPDLPPGVEEEMATAAATNQHAAEEQSTAGKPPKAAGPDGAASAAQPLQEEQPRPPQPPP